MPIAQQTLPIETCGQLLATDGRVLTLREVRLDARAGGGLARVRVEQTFANPFDEPLAVTYRLPLPADAAVVGFCFRIGDTVVRGEIEGRERARERFEEALIQGRTASLLEQDRSSLFTQEVGNIPPGCDVVVEVELDQPLLYSDGEWEWRMPTTAAPRYLGAPGRIADVDKITPPIATDGRGPALRCTLRVDDELTGAVQSPSHEIATDDAAIGALVALPAAGVAMDRDLVVRWPVAASEVGVRLQTARGRDGEGRGLDDAHGLLTLVPPAPEAGAPVLGREVTLLLDTSGSMHGRPLDQLKELITAVLRGLGPKDSLEMVEFSTRPRRWARSAVAVTERNRQKAIRWVQGLSASGGTEMHSALIEATRADVRGIESQRQVILVTDGLIGFEQEIVRAALEGTPRAARLHVVGLGSAPNRSLTQAVARAGRGVEILIGVDESVERPARALLARTEAPALVDLEVSGRGVRAVSPQRLPDVFAGSPTRIALALDPAGGEVVVRGRTAEGTWQQVVAFGPIECESGAAAGVRDAHPRAVVLFGREKAEDLETLAATGENVDDALEALGKAFRIATRRTSWIAVSAAQTVDPGAPLRRDEVAHQLAHGMSVEMLGLRSGMPVPCVPPMLSSETAAQASMMPGAAARATFSVDKKRGLRGRTRSRPVPRRDEFGFDDALADRPLPSEPPFDESGSGDERDRELEEVPAVPPAKPDPATKAEGAAEQAAVVRLSATVRWIAGRAVVEFDADDLGGRDWQRPERVEVHFGDRRLVLEVQAEGSTASGPLARGVRVRLVLDGVSDDALTLPTGLRWTSPEGEAFAIELVAR